MANGMIAWRGGREGSRLQVTNERAPVPAAVMDGQACNEEGS